MLCCLSIPFVIIAIAAILLKIYIKLTIKWNNCYNCLVGKTALVTGANIGEKNLKIIVFYKYQFTYLIWN